MNLFPNPASDLLQLELEGFGDQQMVLQVSNASGETVLTRRLEIGMDWQLEEFSVKELPAGVYAVTLTGVSGQLSEQFIKVE